MKKNIGIVTTWFERGAAYVSRQYKDVLQDDFNVFIYARGGEYSGKGNKVWDSENVTWAKKAYIPVSMSIHKKDFINWIKANDINILFFNEQQWWMPILWAKELNVICGSYIDYYTEETIPLFATFDFLICNTKRHFEAFNWHKNAFYVPWGTNVLLFKQNTYQPVSNEQTVFFHSAGMSPTRKGTDLLIKAFDNLRGNKKLIIHSQADLVQKIPTEKEMIDKLIANNELEVINKVVTAPGLYHLGDVYVYPSRLDGIGLTIAEAISCGLPTIVPNNAPMNEFVSESSGKCAKIKRLFARFDGYYWPQCTVDIEDLTLQMQYYIDNRNNLETLKNKARTFAEKELDWNKNKKEIVSIFKNIKNFKQNNYLKIVEYEQKRASSHWLLVLYYKFTTIYNLLVSVYRFLLRFR